MHTYNCKSHFSRSCKLKCLFPGNVSKNEKKACLSFVWCYFVNLAHVENKPGQLIFITGSGDNGGSGSIPELRVICGLSLLLLLFSKGFLSRYPSFSSLLQKIQFQAVEVNSHLILVDFHRNSHSLYYFFIIVILQYYWVIKSHNYYMTQHFRVWMQTKTNANTCYYTLLCVCIVCARLLKT